MQIINYILHWKKIKHIHTEHAKSPSTLKIYIFEIQLF